MAERELFNDYIDNKGIDVEIQPDMAKKVKQYMRVIAAYKQRTAYKPSVDSKIRIMKKLRKRRLLPYRIGASVATCAILFFMSFSFLQSNTIQVKPRLSIMASIGNFNISEKDSRPDLSLYIDGQQSSLLDTNSSKIDFTASLENQKQRSKSDPGITLSLSGEKIPGSQDNSNIEARSIDFLKGDSQEAFDFPVVNATY